MSSLFISLKYSEHTAAGLGAHAGGAGAGGLRCVAGVYVLSLRNTVTHRRSSLCGWPRVGGVLFGVLLCWSKIHEIIPLITQGHLGRGLSSARVGVEGG